MTYDFTRLGPDEFEKLIQALALKTIGPRISIFGSGPDGGREATWNGPAPSHGKSDNWDGFGVVQAKFAEFASTPASNLSWLKRAITKELNEWARPDSKRTTKPQYILFASNVRLSATPGGGKDSIQNHLEETSKSVGLKIQDSRVWDFDDLRALLDAESSVRRRFSAFIHTSDVLNSLSDIADNERAELARAIIASTARSLLDDSYVGLTQSGAMNDAQVTIADVFVDLPGAEQNSDWQPDDDVDIEAEVGEGDENAEKVKLQAVVTSTASFDDWALEPDESEPIRGVAYHLIESLNESRSLSSSSSPDNTVLVGGPGQGKSTITQWLCEMYRCEFLQGSPVLNNPEILELATNIANRAKTLGLPPIRNRRWPFRVVLTDFADYLASNPSGSLASFIALSVNDRGSTSVEGRHILQWMVQYPSVLFIDGLDEVPESSNRKSVVRAIREFFLEADAREADVTAIATTRPQGYSGEFSSRVYSHIELQPLDTGAALDCARALLEIRYKGSQAIVAKIMQRLENAAKQESTLHLFSTPLQVTILTVLLEKLGKPPGDRWRLFSSYFSVISAREQEKSGELGELLQKYESDVTAIHREIGYILQQRSSAAGETSSELSKSEFETVVRLQFEKQGHGSSEIASLLSDFSRLVTDRLVFLTYGSADKLGFELRSLQEFMAGEYIVSKAEQDVPELLLAFAKSSHWRNVLLFAIGGIFANREHLRAEVVLLCSTLNGESSSLHGVPLGADLAVDILADGACAAMPKYAKALSETAVGLIATAFTAKLRKAASLTDEHSLAALREAARRTSEASKIEWLNRATLLLSLQRMHNDDEQFLRTLVTRAPQAVVNELGRVAVRDADPALAQAVELRLGECSPWDLMKAISVRDTASAARRRKREPQQPDWLSAMTSLNFMAPNTPSSDARRTDGAHVKYRSIHVDRVGWDWVLSSSPQSETWNKFRQFAKFMANPSHEGLALTLETFAIDVPEFDFQVHDLPWPVAACVRKSWAGQSGPPAERTAAIRRSLMELAKQAREGLLGTFDDWARAEEVMPADSLFKREHVETLVQCSTSMDALPIDRSCAQNGVPLHAWGIQVIGASQSDGEAVRDVAARIVAEFSSPAQVDPVRSITEFFVSVALRREVEKFDDAERSSLVRWLSTSVLNNPIVPMRWADWLLTTDSIAENWAELAHACGLAIAPFGPRPHLAPSFSRLVEEAKAHPDLWGVVRLLALWNPKALDEWQTVPRPPDLRDSGLLRIFETLEKFFILRDALRSGVLDDTAFEIIGQMSRGEVGGFGATWLFSAVISWPLNRVVVASLEAIREHDSSFLDARILESRCWAEALSNTPDGLRNGLD